MPMFDMLVQNPAAPSEASSTYERADRLLARAYSEETLEEDDANNIL